VKPTWFDKFACTPGRLTLMEGAFLYAAALAASRIASSGNMLELGTFRGRSTCAIAAACKQVDMRLTTIDNYSQGACPSVGESSEDVVRANLEDAGVADVVTIVNGNSHEYQPLAGLSFIFIDAAHDWESVVADCDTWWKDLQMHGILAFHDGSHPGVAEAVEALGKKHAMRPIAHVGSIIAFEKTGT